MQSRRFNLLFLFFFFLIHFIIYTLFKFYQKKFLDIFYVFDFLIILCLTYLDGYLFDKTQR